MNLRAIALRGMLRHKKDNKNIHGSFTIKYTNKGNRAVGQKVASTKRFSNP